MVIHRNLFAMAAACSVFVLTGCATSSPADVVESATEKPSDRLAARVLTNGECGLFVWTADPARRFILFSHIENPKASWWTEEGEVLIRRSSSGGISSYRQPPKQSFTLADGSKLNLVLSNPEEITEGTRYKSGAIRISDPEGWEKVMPVIGLAGCQAAQN